MIARMKKTRAIVNIADYATIALVERDSWGNPITVKPEDIELIQETTAEEIHWQDIRERAAIAAMQGTINILTDRNTFQEVAVEGFRGDMKTFPNEIAEFAVACADSLIEELKKK